MRTLLTSIIHERDSIEQLMLLFYTCTRRITIGSKRNQMKDKQITDMSCSCVLNQFCSSCSLLSFVLLFVFYCFFPMTVEIRSLSRTKEGTTLGRKKSACF
jgi:hypothetical protein